MRLIEKIATHLFPDISKKAACRKYYRHLKSKKLDSDVIRTAEIAVMEGELEKKKSEI